MHSQLGIQNYIQIETHYLRGGLFENLVINEIMKDYYNQGIRPSLFFWRDNLGNEIDLVDTSDGNVSLYEIKSGQTLSKSFFKGLDHWPSKLDNVEIKKNLIYAGDLSLTKTEANVISWNKFP